MKRVLASKQPCLAAQVQQLGARAPMQATRCGGHGRSTIRQSWVQGQVGCTLGLVRPCLRLQVLEPIKIVGRLGGRG